MKFEITELRSSTVWNLYRMRDRIQVDPDYQRLSDIWTLDERQLLVDTIINDLDIPKIYLHKFPEPFKKGGKTYDYAIIDGKQRLETMWAFIDGVIALAPEFEFFKDETIKAGNMTYTELGQSYPDLKVQFDSFKLSAILVDTDEIEMIEEMFSRLNEAAPLSAPEKRNAFGGPLPRAIRKLAKNTFFKSCLPFTNKRYRHFELATKFLLAEHEGRVTDTKKAYLDKFVADFEDRPRTKMPPFVAKAEDNAQRLAKVFTQKDPLLRQIGIVNLYYHLFRFAHANHWVSEIARRRLADFDRLRAENRKKAEKDIAHADFDLLQFDRYSQSPNDAAAIRFRLMVLIRDVFKKRVAEEDL